MTTGVTGSGIADDPWILTTPPGKSEFEAWRDEGAEPPALVVQVGTTQLRYQLRCIDDLHTMLKERGDWVPLGNADEQKPAQDGTVEAWGRSPANPVGGWYGMKRDCAAGSATTFPRYSKRSASPRSSTTPATTGCAPCDGYLAGLSSSGTSAVSRAQISAAACAAVAAPSGAPSRPASSAQRPASTAARSDSNAHAASRHGTK